MPDIKANEKYIKMHSIVNNTMSANIPYRVFDSLFGLIIIIPAVLFSLNILGAEALFLAVGSSISYVIHVAEK